VTGISDVGFSCLAYTPGVFPSWNSWTHRSGIPIGVYQHDGGVNDFYNQFKPARVRDVHVFCFYGTGPLVVVSTGEPVRTLADVEGPGNPFDGVAPLSPDSWEPEGYAAARTKPTSYVQRGLSMEALPPVRCYWVGSRLKL
jgi:hypothetical protein